MFILFQATADVFAKLAEGLGNLLVPPVCMSCRSAISEHHALCASCWQDVHFVHPPVCDRMGIPLPFDTGGPAVSAAALANPPDYDRARAATHYTGAARKLIHGLKFSDQQELSVLLAKWMLSAGRDLLNDTHLILPVPLSRGRLFWRRFNQSALLAKEIGRQSSIAVATNHLRRKRATRPQVGLTRVQRRTNVEGAFIVPKRRQSAISGRNILLIDDVVTTGSTINACARALKRAGARRVDVLSAAIVAGDTTALP